MDIILSAISKRFSIDAADPPASEAELDKLREYARTLGLELPSDYLSLLRQVTEVEIAVDGKGYIRFWAPAGVPEMNAAHDLQKYMPSAIAVGDDEGGKVFVYMNGGRGPGLYRTSFADPDPNEAVFVASSLVALLSNEEGIDRLFDWVE
jgi:hypothetical protein